MNPQNPTFCAPTKEHPLIVSYNENPLGMSEAARRAAAGILGRGSRYAIARAEALREACARFIGGAPEQVVVSPGSGETIRASIDALSGPDVHFIAPSLTYGTGEQVAKVNGLDIIRVPMGPDWSIDIGGLRRAAESVSGKKIVYFVNPNNPTSTIADCAAFNDWVRSRPADTFFISDEAYAEYADDPAFESAAVCVREGLDNVVVLKTFSKLFAMAGMRVGFAFGHPKVVELLKARYANDKLLNTCAIEAALAEIDDPEFIAYSKSENRKAKEILMAAFDELGLRYLKSQTNFLFVDIGRPLAPFAAHMLEENIWVGRPFPPTENRWCRISVGTVDEMAYLAAKLKEFRAKGWL